MSSTSRRPSAGHKANVKTPATILLILSAVIVVLAFVTLWPAFFAGAQKSALIRIPENATAQMLRDSISKYEGDGYASHVMRLVNLRRTDLSKRYGAYRIEEGMSPFAAMHKLTSGAQSPIRVTITGNRRLYNLAEKIAMKLSISADSLYKEMTNPDLLAKYGLTPETAQTLFFEDTYDMYWTDSPHRVIEKIGNNYLAIWDSQRRRQAEELGLTPTEAMIICSIVDEETNVQDEKGAVARVYINRLNSGMKLQADPTVRYAIGDFTIKRVTGKHLKYDSPYNTYIYAGLPPGPIRTTSRKTLDALLNSAPSFDMYMCAREDFSGKHNFAATYQEHLHNAQLYQEALDKRGIH